LWGKRNQKRLGKGKGGDHRGKGIEMGGAPRLQKANREKKTEKRQTVPGGQPKTKSHVTTVLGEGKTRVKDLNRGGEGGDTLNNQ